MALAVDLTCPLPRSLSHRLLQALRRPAQIICSAKRKMNIGGNEWWNNHEIHPWDKQEYFSSFSKKQNFLTTFIWLKSTSKQTSYSLRYLKYVNRVKKKSFKMTDIYYQRENMRSKISKLLVKCPLNVKRCSLKCLSIHLLEETKQIELQYEAAKLSWIY